MAVPFIDLRRFEEGFQERWAELSREVSENTQFVGGPRVTSLEQRLAREAGVSHAVGCANGTDALQLALRAVGVGSGDLVIIPDATFWATFEAVVNVGARPVTVDIDPDDLQLNYELFCDAVERYRPKAAILVHLYGWCSARLDEFRSFCRERDLPLIEDGAQSWASTWQGQSIYRGALVSTISFYPAKVLGACGDAGALLCESQELADTLRCLGNHGRTSHYEHGLVGWNSRMAGLDAAYLELCLDYLPQRIASRRRAARRYHQGLAELGVTQVQAPQGYEDNGYLYVTLWPDNGRGAVQAALKERGIGFGTVYPGAMSQQPGAEGYLAGRIGGAEAAKLASSVLNLPLFAHIEDSEVDEVLTAISHIATAGARTTAAADNGG